MDDNYIIKKGEHRSGLRFKPYFGRKRVFNFKVIFHASCLGIVDGVDALDANKLFGISFGRHHKNSIRIGWRAVGKKIELCTYHYNNGRRIINWLEPHIDVNKECHFTLKLKDDKYQVIVTDRKFSFYNKTYMNYKFPKWRIGYYLYPYFGGNQPAPKTMWITLQNE